MEWWEQGGTGLPPGWAPQEFSGSGAEGSNNFIANPNLAVNATPEWQQQGGGSGSEDSFNVNHSQALPQTAYDFSNYTRNVEGVPTLDANAFDDWQSNDFLSRMVNTAQGGSIYTGLSALLSGTQNLGAVSGFLGNRADPNSLDDNTYRQLAAYMGLDTNDPNWKQNVLDQSNNYAMVKGMIGNADDPRASKQILYQKGQNGWNPILNYDWHQREKGSWWDEGGKMIMVPLSVIAGGVASGLGAGGAGATAGGITGTGGASGAAAFGSGGLGTTLGTAGTSSLGSGLAGAAGTGSAISAGAGAATGLGGSLANALGYGNEFASLPQFAQSGINGALQGAGNSLMNGQNPLEGAVTGGIMGGITPGLNSTIGSMGLGNTIGGTLTGAAGGGLNALLQGQNPLAGALVGGAGGTVGGGLKDLGMGSVASLGSKYTSQLTGGLLNNALRNEAQGQQQQVLSDVYSEAERRGISRQQLEMFLQTPQGRQAIQALLAQQGKGTLQSLFG